MASRKRQLIPNVVTDYVEVPKTRNEDLARSLTCPICKTWFTPPILSCNNGHGACSKCVKGIEDCRLPRDTNPAICAVCKSGNYVTHLTCLEAVCEAVVTECEYGCGIQIPCLLASRHKLECEYRPMPCTYGCDLMVEMGDIEAHLTKKHSLLIENFLDTLELNSAAFFSTEGNGSQVYKKNYLLDTSCGEKFILSEQVNSSDVSYYVKLIGREQKAKNYVAVLSIHADDDACKLTYRLPVYSAAQPLGDFDTELGVAVISGKLVLKWNQQRANPPYWVVSLCAEKKVH